MTGWLRAIHCSGEELGQAPSTQVAAQSYHGGRHVIIFPLNYLAQIDPMMLQLFTRQAKNNLTVIGRLPGNESFQPSMHEIEFCATTEKFALSLAREYVPAERCCTVESLAALQDRHRNTWKCNQHDAQQALPVYWKAGKVPVLRMIHRPGYQCPRVVGPHTLESKVSDGM